MKLSDMEFRQEEIQKRKKTQQLNAVIKGKWMMFQQKVMPTPDSIAQPMETVILEKVADSCFRLYPSSRWWAHARRGAVLFSKRKKQ